MEGNSSQKKQRAALNPWLFILASALVPLILSVFFFFQWWNQRGDLKRLTAHFVQRQNSVLAVDATEVAANFADLLEKAGRDVVTLSVVPVTAENFGQFYRAQMGDFTHYDSRNGNIVQEPLPFYNRVAFLDSNGEAKLRIKDGKVDTSPLPLSQCLPRDLCDRGLFEKALKLPTGEIQYGRILRYYSPEGTPEVDDGASLSVAYRTAKGVFVVGIDYKHLRDHLTTPVFPYEPKRDLLEAYKRGNYIYIVDSEDNIITHPRYWNAAGVDSKTGKWIDPMRDDADYGKRPINIAAYERGVLKEQFQRFLKNSFTQRGVDIFRAPNLSGTFRVISVTPINLSKGQFKKSGVFGHAVISCNVDYFEEPKERIIPYY